MKKISVILVLCIISGMLSGCVISDVKDKIVSVVQSKNGLTENLLALFSIILHEKQKSKGHCEDMDSD